jgi:hypothetical protein
VTHEDHRCTITSMGTKQKPVRGLIMAGALAMVLASCAIGRTGAPTQVTDTSARFTGTVHSTVAGPATYWFEYGTATAYGSRTPTRTVEVTDPDVGPAVSEVATGLLASTTYHVRLCARDPEGVGGCGADQTLTTDAGHDSVTGTGVVYEIAQLGFSLGARLDASSDPDGSEPRGEAVVSPGSYYFKVADRGVVTCLRIAGNRAAIGVTVVPPGIGEPPESGPYHHVVFVEDNGPTGDRYDRRSYEAPVDTCPVPAATDFADFTLNGMLTIPPVVTMGDFVVHDHPAGP